MFRQKLLERLACLSLWLWVLFLSLSSEEKVKMTRNMRTNIPPEWKKKRSGVCSIFLFVALFLVFSFQ